MHKNPYIHRFIAGSSNRSAKSLSILLTKLLTHIKQCLQKYYETAYSGSWMNQMWILKNSKELLDHLKSPTFNLITSIKFFDFLDPLNKFLTKNLKTGSQLSSGALSFTKHGNRRYNFFCFRSRRTVFCQGRFLFENQVH